MLYEQPIAFGLTGIASALILPELSAVLSQPDKVPSLSVLLGSALGAFGVYTGALLYSTHQNRSRRILFVALWGLVAVGLCISIFLCTANITGFWQNSLFILSSLLPPVVYVFVIRSTGLTELFSK